VRFRFWQPQQKEKAVGVPRNASVLPAEFEAIRQRFAERLHQDYAVLAQYRAEPVTPVPDLVSTVHRLAGSAAMVGFLEIGDAAGRLDDAFVEPEADVGALLNELLGLLEKTISNG
jgi:HPt (histidine-containing phosphotransfer) domain-containing protein